MTLSLSDTEFEDAPSPMWVNDAQTLQFLQVNSAACKRYGYTQDEFLSMTLLDVRSPEDREPVLDQSVRPNRIWKHMTKSGEILYVETYTFRFETNGRSATLATIAEVTERIKLEQERTELLGRYQILSEAANDLLWDWDLRTNQVTHNEALITQYGYDRSDLQQPISWWSDKIHPEDFDIAAWSIQAAIQEKRRFWTAEYRLKKADGAYVLVLDRGILYSENDQPVRMIGSIVDLTTRRAAEDERNQLFRLSIDSMLFMDPNGTIMQANAAFYALAGFQPLPGVRRNIREFLNSADTTILDQVLRQAIDSGAEGSFSTSIDTDAGRGKTIHWGLITNESRSRLFLVGRDITESIVARQELEQALVRSQELAIEAEAARSAQTEFLQNMSHELRTPMNGMLGTAQILGSTATDAKQRSLTEVLVRSGESLLRILNDILDFSKMESGTLTLDNAPFQLTEAIQVVVDLFSPSATQKGLDFRTHFSADAQVQVLGDQFRLRQVISNLVGNAIKFTDHGFIQISLAVQPVAPDQIEAVLKVQDSGIGVPQEAQNLVFDRFVQVNSTPTRRHGGTGLGLSIAKNVVELMGGDIRLQSELGKGSEFTIQIPFCLAADAVVLPSSDQAFSAASKSGTKVLIAEDVEVNAMILTVWLEERGFDCVVVTTGSEAGDALQNGGFEGAFLDLHMPDATGYEVVRLRRAFEARSDSKRLPLIAVTASVSLEERQKCLAEGFDDYIPKPILVSDLDRVIGRLF